MTNIKQMTTYHVDAFVRDVYYPDDVEDLQNLIEMHKASGTKYIILGNGSNVLFGNNLCDFSVICTKKLKKIAFLSKNVVKFDAGIMLSAANVFLAKHNLGGFERLASVPGTIGASIRNNSGAFGDEISGRLLGVEVLSPDGRVRYIKKDDILFGKHSSTLQGSGDIVLSGVFELEKGSFHSVMALTHDYMCRRARSQPQGYSAGCVFKAHDGIAAGFLLDRAGLKNERVGGACVSNKHANFIINDSGATNEDIHKLIEICKEKVYQKFGIKLCEEIDIFGDFDEKKIEPQMQ